MAPATPNRPSTAARSQQATPSGSAPLSQELPEMPMDTDDEEEEILETHPASHKDEVKKLKRTIKEMKKTT
jgi:hypothetical protein